MKMAKGDKLLLLNNDTVILEQEPNTWINILLSGFAKPQAGITAPLINYSDTAGMEFAVFFCAMIDRRVVDKIGYLDEIFSPGSGEDVDYCVRAFRAGYLTVGVPVGQTPDRSEGMPVGPFPFYHRGEITVWELPDWDAIYKRNEEILADRYNPGWKERQKKWDLSNNWERIVFGYNDPVLPREAARYKWAAEAIKEYGQGDTSLTVAELGCSSGYGIAFIGDLISEYKGWDYGRPILAFAEKEYGPHYPHASFNYTDIAQDYEEGNLAKYTADVIIAFEILEHLDAGREIAQELKKYCKLLLLTTPYKEPPGFWGPHHKIHRITRNDFPGFEYQFISGDGRIQDEPWGEPDADVNLILMKWEKTIGTYPLVKDTIATKDKVCAYLVTRDRYFTTLPMAITAIAMQTLKPDHFIIIDDGAHEDLPNKYVLYQYLFNLLTEKGIPWEVRMTEGKGQHWGHEDVNQWCVSKGIKWAWRVDDDEIPEPNVLEEYMRIIGEQDTPESPIGAVGNLCKLPMMNDGIDCADKNLEKYYGLKIQDCDMPNVQWSKRKPRLVETEHLHSSFIYRTGVAHYEMSLSPVAHREETLFSWQIHKAGYKLLVDTGTTTYHFRNPEGGIRVHKDPTMWTWDEKVFQGKLTEAGVKPKEKYYVVLANGLGDHHSFTPVIPLLKKAHPNTQLVIAAAHASVFEDIKDIKIISIGAAIEILGDIERYSIYGWMERTGWKQHITEAYKEFYGVNTHKPVLKQAKKRAGKPEGLPPELVDRGWMFNDEKEGRDTPSRSSGRKKTRKVRK